MSVTHDQIARCLLDRQWLRQVNRVAVFAVSHTDHGAVMLFPPREDDYTDAAGVLTLLLQPDTSELSIAGDIAASPDEPLPASPSSPEEPQ